MTTHTSITRRLVSAVAVVGLMAVGVVGWMHTSSSAAADTAPAGSAAAAHWLEDELTAGGGHLQNFGVTDWGVTADAILAVVAAAGSTPEAADAAGQLVANVDHYATWDDLGPANVGVLLAGPLAKTLLVSEAVGASAPVVEAELRSLLVTTGARGGRLADRNAIGGDISNGFSQALGDIALARTTSGTPASAIDFLVRQQCANGGFRLFYPDDAGCTDDAVADPDSTALAIEALLTAQRTPSIASSLSRAVGWLIGIQDPTTGSFSGSGPTAAPNTNSTGVAAQALRAAGQTAAADRAATWITSLQLTAPALDAGAIAYDPGGFASISDGRIGDQVRDQFHRATAQAVLALGAPPFGTVGLAVTPPADPVDPVTPTSPVPRASDAPTTTTTAPPTTTSTAPPTTTIGVAASTSTPAGVADPVTPAATALALTGNDVAPGLALAGLSIAAGTFLLLWSRRRRVN